MLGHGTHSLRGECAAPGGCWLLPFLLGAVCCEKLFCWYHKVLSVVWGFAAVSHRVLGWKEPWSHLGTVLCTVLGACGQNLCERRWLCHSATRSAQGRGFGVLFVALAAGSGGTWGCLHGCCSCVSLCRGTENGSNHLYKFFIVFAERS